MSKRMHSDLPRDLWDVSIAVDRAYAPLREASVRLSPARARLVARAPHVVPIAVRLGALATQLNKLALAAAVTAFAFVGTTSVAPRPSLVNETDAPAAISAHASTRLDDESFIRWLRIGRYAPTQDLLDPAVPPRQDPDETQILRERSGLVR